MSEPASRLVGYTDAKLSCILPEMKEVIKKLEGWNHTKEEIVEEFFLLYKELQELHKRIQEG